VPWSLEDNNSVHSSFLPVDFYTELIKQSRGSFRKAINVAPKLVRMQARPKICLEFGTLRCCPICAMISRLSVLAIVSDVEVFPGRARPSARRRLLNSPPPDEGLLWVGPMFPRRSLQNQPDGTFSSAGALERDIRFSAKTFAPLLKDFAPDSSPSSLALGFVFRLPT